MQFDNSLASSAPSPPYGDVYGLGSFDGDDFGLFPHSQESDAPAFDPHQGKSFLEIDSYADLYAGGGGTTPSAFVAPPSSPVLPTCGCEADQCTCQAVLNSSDANFETPVRADSPTVDHGSGAPPPFTTESHSTITVRVAPLPPAELVAEPAAAPAPAAAAAPAPAAEPRGKRLSPEAEARARAALSESEAQEPKYVAKCPDPKCTKLYTSNSRKSEVDRRLRDHLKDAHGQDERSSDDDDVEVTQQHDCACNECGQVFNSTGKTTAETATSVKKHMRTFHPDQRVAPVILDNARGADIKCAHCRFSFMSEEFLAQHVAAKHSPEKKRARDDADSDDASPSKVKRSRSAPVQAPAPAVVHDEPKAPAQAMDVDDDEPLKCYFCELRYATQQAREAHVTRAHFTCDTCNAQFGTHVALVAHKGDAHPPPLRYQCKFCGERFRSFDDRQQHVDMHHDRANSALVALEMATAELSALHLKLELVPAGERRSDAFKNAAAQFNVIINTVKTQLGL